MYMDEIDSFDILYADENVPEELYTLVRDGLCSQLDDRLHQLTNPNQYLTTASWHNREQVSLLMVAALNGYDDIVRVLLTHCNSIDQVELKGQINIPDEICIDGATALYCACYRGQFAAAKTLIELGKANVNQDTCDNPYYPLLIHATIMNRLDIVRFLVENKYADVNETKSNDGDKCTALIWAASRGHTLLVKYLIENGADVNYFCDGVSIHYGSPLQLAIRAGHVETVQLLCTANANVAADNQNGHSLLCSAAQYKHYGIINFLLEQSINSIEDLELVACSLIDISSSIEQMHDALELLKLALQRRERLNLPKICVQTMDIYNYQQECQTIDELDGIKDDRHRIVIETLLIQERIYSFQSDVTIIKSLANYGDKLASEEEFIKSLNTYVHIFDLHQKMDIGTYLCRFVWLFCKMFTANRKIPVDRFIQVCYLTLKPPQSIDIELKINNALFLVIIATKILEQEGITKEEQGSIYRWIQDLCRYRLTTERGQTLLHLCVDRQTNDNLNFRGSDTTSHLRFPNESGLRLLMAYGSRWLDIDAIESSHGNTPLHLICQRTHQDQNIIKLLLSFGCHLDCINKDGKIPLDYVANEETKALFIPKITPKRLKCLCACIIANERLKIDTLESSTSALNKFIVLHGSLHIQS